jgi:hypothetical protein
MGPFYRVTILLSTPPRWRGGGAAFRRWVVLGDYEQRALDELERSLATEALGSSRPGAFRRTGPPGVRTVGVLGVACTALIVAGVPVAGVALATATVIGWAYWRLGWQRGDKPPGSPGAASGSHPAWLFQRPTGW